MATPTLSQMAALAVEWWQEPGLPRLAVLQARLCALWTDSNAIVRVRIDNVAGTYTLVAELERNGTIVTRSWTPQRGSRQETLADIYQAAIGKSLREAEGGSP